MPGSPPCQNPTARRALSMSIDRVGIAKAVLRYPEGATQLFPPSVAGWHDAALPPLAYNPDEAKALLEGLGWQAGEDGILTREGERFELTLTTYPDRPELPLVAAVLEQQFRAIGVAPHDQHHQLLRDPGRASGRLARPWPDRAELLVDPRSHRHGSGRLCRQWRLGRDELAE